MSEELDHDLPREERSVVQPRRTGAFGILKFVVSLALIGGACAYLWLNFGNPFQLSNSTGRLAAAPAVAGANAEPTVLLKDFKTFQQQTADSLQAATQEIAAQKADLKSLSDQVSALTAKNDALQRSAPPTGSISGELRRGPPQVPSPTRPLVAPGPRKPPSPKITGPISTGGAPLPPLSSDDR